MKDLWTQCLGHQQIKALRLEAWRVVEDQSRSSTRQLVDSLEEHEILEQEIENVKPHIAMNCEGFHYLLFTPFRYPPLKYGSRFGNQLQPSLWYGSHQLMTALAENAYYRFVFVYGTKAQDRTDRVSKTAFSVKIATEQGLDFTKAPFALFRDRISSPLSWQESQALGNRMRENEIEAFSYFSARYTEEAVNVGVFSCRAFKQKSPHKFKNLIMHSNHTTVEFYDNENQDTYVFRSEDFNIDNLFPFPPK